MDQESILNFTVGRMPDNFCPSDWDEVAQTIVARIVAAFGVTTVLFASGSTPPIDTSKIWIKNGVDFWYFDTVSGTWLPMTPSSITGQVPVGTVISWAGAIANGPGWFNINGAEWQFADGTAISRAAYAELFGAIGTIWGVGDAVTTFNKPDTKDIVIAGANQDDSGVPKSLMGDGATLLQSRAYFDHKHARQAATAVPPGSDGIADAANYSTGALDPASDNVTITAIRTLPPFKVMPYFIRVK